MAIQQTYSMIKPDGVRNGHIGEIINRFERAGLTVERMELGMVTPEQAKANYAEHEGKPFYDGLIAYITTGPVVKMVVSGEGAVAKCRSSWAPPTPPRRLPAPSAAISASSWTRTSFTAPTALSPPSARSASSSRKNRFAANIRHHRGPAFIQGAGPLVLPAACRRAEGAELCQGANMKRPRLRIADEIRTRRMLYRVIDRSELPFARIGLHGDLRSRGPCEKRVELCVRGRELVRGDRA